VIEIEGITKRYGETTVVDDVSMVIEPRSITVIVGT
jgi:osmoprotectant transport system ATP-binding protein